MVDNTNISGIFIILQPIIHIIIGFILGIFSTPLSNWVFCKDNEYGAYILVIVSFIIFVSHFVVTFLGLDIQSKVLSLKRQVQSLESSQEELKQISTAFYKLILINFELINHLMDSGKYKDKHALVRKEIDQYIDFNDLSIFLDEMELIKKNLPETQVSKILKILNSNSKNFGNLLTKLNT